MKIVRMRQIALYGECKLTTADMTVKIIGIIKATTSLQTRLPEYNLTRLRKQLKHKDLNQPEVVKLRKIIRDPTELMDLSIKLQDVTAELKTHEIHHFCHNPLYI